MHGTGIEPGGGTTGALPAMSLNKLLLLPGE